MRLNHLSRVMPALVARIHAFLCGPLPTLPRKRGRVGRGRRGWPGQAPAMTPNEWFNMTGNRCSPQIFRPVKQALIPGEKGPKPPKAFEAAQERY
jgi:hypothetical protein